MLKFSGLVSKLRKNTSFDVVYELAGKGIARGKDPIEYGIRTRGEYENMKRYWESKHKGEILPEYEDARFGPLFFCRLSNFCF